MTATLEELKRQIDNLSPDDRGELSDYLFATFDHEEHDRLWKAEIARRIADVREGQVQCIPGEEAMAKLREKYR